MSANVLIVSGLKREAAILAGPGRTTLCGDASILRAKLGEAADLGPLLVVSWGLCGGLDPRLRPGDLILGAEVVSDKGAIRTDEAVTASLAQRLVGAGSRVVVERLVAAHAPVLTAAAKAELRRATGAAGVDMESLIAGQYALEQRTPFAILRAVADPAERDLPPLVLKAVRFRRRDQYRSRHRRAYPLSEPVRTAPRCLRRQQRRVPRAKPLSRPSSWPFPRPRPGGSLKASG